MNYNLELYRQLIISIQRGNYRGKISNAKPIYLYALIEFITNMNNLGVSIDNKFLPNNKILRNIYECVFAKFGLNKPTNFIQPFFHLVSEPFYELIWKGEEHPKNNSNAPSQKYLLTHLAYAKLDDELWELLQDAGNREYLKNVIIETYLS